MIRCYVQIMPSKGMGATISTMVPEKPPASPDSILPRALITFSSEIDGGGPTTEGASWGHSHPRELNIQKTLVVLHPVLHSLFLIIISRQDSASQHLPETMLCRSWEGVTHMNTTFSSPSYEGQDGLWKWVNYECLKKVSRRSWLQSVTSP